MDNTSTCNDDNIFDDDDNDGRLRSLIIDNLLKLVRRRRYAYPPIVDDNVYVAKQKVTTFTTTYVERENIDDVTRNVKIYIFDNVKISTAVIKDVICADGNRFDLIIIVHKLPLTTMAKSALNSTCSLRFQNFPFASLTYDIEELVPNHALANREEINDFDFKKIPVINSKTDPVAKYYGFKRDDLIRIIGYDGIIEYRRCV